MYVLVCVNVCVYVCVRVCVCVIISEKYEIGLKWPKYVEKIDNLKQIQSMYVYVSFNLYCNLHQCL